MIYTIGGIKGGTIEKVSKLIREMKAINPDLKSFAFLNRADPRGNDNQDAKVALQDIEDFYFLDTPIGNRKSFSNASAQGMSIVELKPKDTKAVAEIKALYKKCILL